jgi:hypothetical protein
MTRTTLTDGAPTKSPAPTVTVCFALALALASVLAPAPALADQRLDVAPARPPIIVTPATEATLPSGVQNLRRTPALSTSALAPFIRLAAPEPNAVLHVGTSVIVTWSEIGLETVTVDLVYPSEPTFGIPAASTQGWAVRLHTGPATAGKVLIPLKMGHAQRGGDGEPLLRISGRSADGRTVLDERPVRILVPTIALHLPPDGADLQVGQPFPVRWSCPRAPASRVRFTLFRIGASKFDPGFFWFGPSFPTTGSGAATLTIPASALDNRDNSEPYGGYGLRIVGEYDPAHLPQSDWPQDSRSVVLRR